MDQSENESPLLRLLLTGGVAGALVFLAGIFYWAFRSDESGDTGTDSSPSSPEVVGATGGRDHSDPSGRSMLSPDASPNGRSGVEVRPSEEAAEEPESADFSQSFEGVSLDEVDPSVRDEMRSIAESNRSQSEKVARFKSYFADDNDAAVQSLAVRHLSKLVDDNQYHRYLAPELLDPAQSEPVQAALIRDINARPRQVMIEVMTEIATGGEHPLMDYAHQTLGRYLGDNYTDDPEVLRGVVQEYIRRSKDEF